MAGNNHSQIATIDALNTMWSEGVVPIYDKLNDRIPTTTAGCGLLIDVDSNATDLKTYDLYNTGIVTLEPGNLNATTNKGKIGYKKLKDDKSGLTTVQYANVNGWNTKQDVATAVKFNGSKVGDEDRPVYVNNDGVVAPIESLVLYDVTAPEDEMGTLATFKGSNSAAVVIYGPGSATTDPTAFGNAALFVKGSIRATEAISAAKVYHAVWNDISDAIEVQDTLKTDPGYCYYFDGTEYHRTTKYCQKGIIGVHSDTAGDILGRKGKHKELDIAIGGFVLAYVDKYYAPGTPLTSAPDGKLTKMSLWSRIFHPERLVATYWKPEMEAEWGDETHTVEVNGRHWVKVR